MNREETGSGAILFARREFIVLGTTALAGVVASSASGQLGIGSLAIDAPPTLRFSLGYADVLVAPHASSVTETRAVVAAETIQSADPALAAGARLSILGFTRPSARRRTPASLALDAAYRVGGEVTVPFQAWTYATNAGQTSIASSASFVVPIDAAGSVSLRLSLRNENTVAESTVINLSTTNEHGLQKLRGGMYFIAITGIEEPPPDWTSLRVAFPNGGKAPVLQRALLAGEPEPAPFEYLTFTAARPHRPELRRATD